MTRLKSQPGLSDKSLEYSLSSPMGYRHRRIVPETAGAGGRGAAGWRTGAGVESSNLAGGRARAGRLLFFRKILLRTWIPGRFTEPAALPERLAQEEFNLGVEGAQVVVGPLFHGIEHFRVDPQQE